MILLIDEYSCYPRELTNISWGQIKSDLILKSCFVLVLASETMCTYDRRRN